MDRLEFEAELRREGYSVVNSSLKPNLERIPVMLDNRHGQRS